jgi:uncharacterized iron-regulated protein
MEQNRIIVFGEVASNESVIHYETQIINHLTQDENSTLNIIMEHFDFEMQFLLDDYQKEKITFDELIESCKQVGGDSEYNLRKY